MVASLTQPLEAVAISDTCRDPAIDMSEPEWSPDSGLPQPISSTEMLSRYRESRDMAILRFRDGARPTIFAVKRLPAPYMLGSIYSLPGEAMQAMLAFCSAVHEIRPGDSPEPMKPKRLRDVRYGVRIADEDPWVQEVADKFGSDVVLEMGRLAIKLAKLRPGERGPFA